MTLENTFNDSSKSIQSISNKKPENPVDKKIVLLEKCIKAGCLSLSEVLFILNMEPKKPLSSQDIEKMMKL